MPCSSDLNSELVKFTWEQLSAKTAIDEEVKELRSICNKLDENDLVTAYAPPAIPGSNGNLSYRYGDKNNFIITATQLPSKRGLEPSDFTIVDRYEFSENSDAGSKAFYHGIKLPSSEAILHWYYYVNYPEINAIIHVHEITDFLYSRESRAMWSNLDIIETPRNGVAGTIDLPLSVEEVLKDFNQYVILKDHYADWDRAHTGTVVFGKTLQETFQRVSDIHQQLLTLNECE